MKLKPYIAVCLALLLALMLAPFTSQARYLNPATGRFWTMDTYEGSNEDPRSLHKYLYAAGNSVNLTDPSGKEYQAVGMLGAIDIGRMFFAAVSPAAGKAKSSAAAAVAGRALLPENQPAGMVQRLLLAESWTPMQEKLYDEEAVFQGMDAIGACVVNRVKSKRFPNTVDGVIKDPGQFRGFEPYPNITEPKIVNKLNDIKKYILISNKFLPEFQSLVRYAEFDAKRTLQGTIDDPFVNEGGTFGLRTTGRAPPGGDFIELGSIAGNTFYTLPAGKNGLR